MQDKEEERSLVNVEKKLNADGFKADFVVSDSMMHTMDNDKKTYAPEDVTIVDFYRFEGESNPGDMTILYAIEASDGIRGTISSAYGPYADTATDDFLKKIEDLGKNLTKSHK